MIFTNKKERVLAAIRGDKVDRVPMMFSLHFPREEAYGSRAVEAHARFYAQTDCDILKIMNEHLMPPIGEIRAAEDWNRVRRYEMDEAFLTDQVDMVSRILDATKAEYSLATIHGVCASTIHPIERTYGYVRAREIMCQTLRSDRQIMVDAHRRVADTMSDLAQACVRAGVDGVYYAALGGEKHFYTDEEFETCIKPYDLQIMQAIREAGGHVFLHICKENLDMERYRDYAPFADVVNWGVYEAPLTLTQGRALFPDCAILGGLANRSGVLVDGTDEELAAAVRAILDEAGTEKFLLGADCTLPTEIPCDRIRMVQQILCNNLT